MVWLLSYTGRGIIPRLIIRLGTETGAFQRPAGWSGDGAMMVEGAMTWDNLRRQLPSSYSESCEYASRGRPRNAPDVLGSSVLDSLWNKSRPQPTGSVRTRCLSRQKSGVNA